MTRWRVVELQPGDAVPPRVVLGLQVVLDSDDVDVVDLVERAASAAGVTLARVSVHLDEGTCNDSAR